MSKLSRLIEEVESVMASRQAKEVECRDGNENHKCAVMPTDAFISCRDANGWRDGSWVILNKVYKGGRPRESFILQREAREAPPQTFYILLFYMSSLGRSLSIYMYIK